MGSEEIRKIGIGAPLRCFATSNQREPERDIRVRVSGIGSLGMFKAEEIEGEYDAHHQDVPAWIPLGFGRWVDDGRR
jgi:hypothetical protein